MKIVVHAGMVWAYQIASGWFLHLRAFPMAMKKIGDDIVPDMEHASVLTYVEKCRCPK